MSIHPRGLMCLLALPGVAMLSACSSSGSLNVPQIRVDSTQARTYHCEGGKSFTVTYSNSHGGQSFALLPVDGTPMLFVNVIAGSGAKYVAGSYTWWTKGERGDLYNAMSGPDAPAVIAGCSSQAAP